MTLNTTDLRRSLICSALVLLPAVLRTTPLLTAETSTYAIFAYDADDRSAYSAGTLAMNEHRWSDAVTSFDQVIGSKSRNVDAALYWKAYSLNRLGKRSLAIATCVQLNSQFPASSWNKDCSALSMDVRVNVRVDTPPFPPMPPGDPAVARGSDADLKILALNSLLHQDPAKAIPMLRGILAGNQPIGIKKHAIFVLAQSKSPEAASILHDAVVGKLDPGLQNDAIQMMGVFQGQRANETLAEVYRTTSDAQVKRSVISAFFISHDAPRMVELARAEKDLEIKRSIVSQLALMNDKAATDYMLELLK